MLFQRKMLTMAMAGTLAACVGLNANAADNSFPSNVVSAYSQGWNFTHIGTVYIEHWDTPFLKHWDSPLRRRAS